MAISTMLRAGNSAFPRSIACSSRLRRRAPQDRSSRRPRGPRPKRPSLVAYFAILSDAAPAPIEARDAARTELAWWQARREAVAPQEYGLIIARVATLVYGVEGEDLRRSGVVRAQAMAYRDARDASMSEADWSTIADRLELAYGLLKKALPAPVPE
jgi:hypothetical protein